MIKESIKIIIDAEKGNIGFIKPIGTAQNCDVCLNGMFLNYASYFKTKEDELKSVLTLS